MARTRRKRAFSVFSLSFLDIMACGFGAVTLLFLILKHDVDAVETADPNLAAEVNLLHEDIRLAEEDLVTLRNSLKQIEEKIVTSQGLSHRVLAQIEETKRELSLQSDPEDEVAVLREQVKALEEQTASLRESGRNDDLRRFIGDGDRQYLTGLKLGGRRIMILLDSSASMLSESIVNIVRRRNMDDETKRQSPKWVRAKRTVEWLVAQLPPQSQVQIYTFSTEAAPVLAATKGQWLDTSDKGLLDQLFAAMEKTVPEGGTSLLNAFSSIKDFPNAPDNLFLITDGLPTQGASRPKQNTVSGAERLKLFEQAVKTLPKGLTVNIILFPMEGDPQAAAGFWQLALQSKGAFLSPSRDWP